MPIESQTVAEDTAWSFQVPADVFADVDDASLTISATLGDGSPLPDWLSFDATTRTFSGTPPQDFNGEIQLRLTASDGEFETSEDFTLTVTPVNDAPTRTATPVTLASIFEDQATSATDPTVVNNGATVSSLFSGVFSDAADAVSGGSSANALAGVVVVTNTANSLTQGK